MTINHFRGSNLVASCTFTTSCNSHLSRGQVHQPRREPLPIQRSPHAHPPHPLRSPIGSLPVSVGPPDPDGPCDGILYHVAFIRLLSLSVMFSGFVHAQACVSAASFARLMSSQLCVGGPHPYPWSVDGHVSGFPLLAAVNACAHTSVRTSVFNSFESIPRSGISRPGGNSMFNFLMNHQMDLLTFFK